MGGCSAPNCFSNNSRKGNHMCRFPIDVNRKKIWADQVGRLNKDGTPWVPGAGAQLCNVSKQ